ncbi:MAG: alpha/beta hydrolase-fold protein [bacterium]
MIVDLTPPAWATHLLSDATDWNRAPVPAAEVGPFEIPDDAYFEYAWLDGDGERRPDPDNPNPRLNPWWPYACHLTGPDYRPDPYTLRTDRPAAGRTLRLDVGSVILGEKRRLLVYTPPGMAGRALPHVLFQDGMAYYGWGKAAQTLDLLLEEGRIEPAHLVFVPPNQRTREYAFNPDYRRFLAEEALPAAEGRAPCDGRRIAWGVSLGGLLSAMLAWERPDLFGRVVSQSGAFSFSPDMDFDHPFGGGEEFLRAVRTRTEPLPDVAWRLDCGTLEWLTPSNRKLAGLLAERGLQAELDLRSAGHNWVNWRNGMAAGFRFALGS